MAQYRIAPRARADVLAIWRRIAENASVDTARRFSQQLHERFSLLAEQPRMGRARPEVSPDIRSHPVGDYVIFYRPTDYGVEIAHVRHARRRALDTMDA